MTTLNTGDKAPNFKSLDQNGETIKLSDYEGKKLILFFYPRDNTPTCTIEVCNLRDNYAALQTAGYQLLGVSADSQKKHQNFIKKHDLPFPLLADETKEMIKITVFSVKKRCLVKLKKGFLEQHLSLMKKVKLIMFSQK